MISPFQLPEQIHEKNYLIQLMLSHSQPLACHQRIDPLLDNGGSFGSTIAATKLAMVTVT